MMMEIKKKAGKPRQILGEVERDVLLKCAAR
jgi:hypothetical protein